MAGKNIRIYDLAKELKLDNKKVIDDVRREGVDASVPSNSVPFAVAERIRAKYFPKKAAPLAGPRLVKTIKKVEQAPAADEAAYEPHQDEAAPDEQLESQDIHPTTQSEAAKPAIRVL